MTPADGAAPGPFDFEARAAAGLPDHVRAYYAAAAGSGAGLPEGIADWSSVRFRPRVLRDTARVDLSTTALGTTVRTPILVAPMAQQLGAHPQGEAAMGRAVARAGSLLGVSTNTAVDFAAIAGSGAPWWFQVYVSRARSLTELLVRRAVTHGARALLLTVDMNASLPSPINPLDWPDSPAKRRLDNLTPEEIREAGPGGTDVDLSLGFDTIGWLREISGLPILVKGVLRADDALQCVDAGAAGVVVSTHGGRRMGPSVSSAYALPEVVAAVGQRCEVYVDSGIRSGEHVAAALALGARAVFVGRPALWSLAADGERGVQSVINGLTGELAQVMVQLGASQLDQLTPDLVAPFR